MIEDAAYASTYDRLPRVRLSDDRRSAMCFDADCGTVFARRVEPPEGPPQDAYLVFEPGWIYQGSIWRSRPTEEGMSARQLESTLRATARMRECRRHTSDGIDTGVRSSFEARSPRACSARRAGTTRSPSLSISLRWKRERVSARTQTRRRSF